MNSRGKVTLILVGVLLVLAGTSVISYFFNKIPDNPPETVGNTTGNLYNNGLFCESDGKIYFSNPYDNGSLYSMNADESDIKKLHEGSSQFINAGGNYLYYWQPLEKSGGAGMGYLRNVRGLYRIKKDGSKVAGLSRDASGCVKLLGSTLYYQHYTKETGVTLHSMGIDKKGDQVLAEKKVSPAATYDNRIYYGGFEKDHNLYAIDLATGMNAIVLQADLCYPTVEDGYVYYMDVKNNYRLCRVDLMNPEAGATALTQDRVDVYNVYGDVIFYQRNSETEPALIRMNLDGSNPQVIAEGNYTNINCTGNYTYFTLFGEEVPVYKTPTFGSGNVTTFDGARDAALAN